jgi:arylsulfatase A-like enzyme/Tfp pilus assembly protein PilF
MKRIDCFCYHYHYHYHFLYFITFFAAGCIDSGASPYYSACPMSGRKRMATGGGAKRGRVRALWLAGAAFALLAALAAVFAGDARSWMRRRRLRAANVVLITLDTLRADHVGCYAAGRVRTPGLDSLAADGVLFEEAVTPTPLTLPAHATILSGVYPFTHQVRDNRLSRVPAGLPLLSESLRSAGMDTAAFLGSMVLDSAFGLDRGFDLYADRFAAPDAGDFWSEVRKPADAVLAEAREWISGRDGRPFFAWIHLYDPHAPWDPPEPFRGQYPGHPYRGAVAFMDAELGKFFAFLKESRLWQRTLVVVVADHGEGLGEHGEETHGFFVYQATMRVPFLVRLPFPAGGRRVAQRVELTDVAPTILAAKGLPVPRSVQGRSLLDAVLGGPLRRADEAYGESHYPRLHFGWSELRAFYHGGLKYIQAPQQELYDLGRDPGETRNLAAERPEECRRLRGLLLRKLDAAGPALPAVEPRLDPAARERLAALGYVTSVAGAVPSGSAVDPKDRIGVLDELRRVKELAARGDWAGAGGLARRILAANPQIGQARIASANAYRAAGDFAGAVAELRAGLERRGDDDQMLALLGETLSLAGRFQEALAAFQGCLAVQPANPASHNNLGLALANLGRIDEAEAAYRRAIGLDPRFALPRVNLGLLYLTARRDLPRARAALLEAVAADPQLAAAHDALGDLFASAGDFARAAGHWRRGLELEPGNYQACFNLFMVYGRKLSDRGRALEYYERLRRDFFPHLPDGERRRIEEQRRRLD